MIDSGCPDTFFVACWIFTKTPIRPPPYSSFKSSSHAAADASDGMRQSPRGLSEHVPTFGPSGKQERLNCCAKKRR